METARSKDPQEHMLTGSRELMERLESLSMLVSSPTSVDNIVTFANNLIYLDLRCVHGRRYSIKRLPDSLVELRLNGFLVEPSLRIIPKTLKSLIINRCFISSDWIQRLSLTKNHIELLAISVRDISGRLNNLSEKDASNLLSMKSLTHLEMHGVIPQNEALSKATHLHTLILVSTAMSFKEALELRKCAQHIRTFGVHNRSYLVPPFSVLDLERLYYLERGDELR